MAETFDARVEQCLARAAQRIVRTQERNRRLVQAPGVDGVASPPPADGSSFAAGSPVARSPSLGLSFSGSSPARDRLWMSPPLSTPRVIEDLSQKVIDGGDASPAQRLFAGRTRMRRSVSSGQSRRVQIDEPASPSAASPVTPGRRPRRSAASDVSEPPHAPAYAMWRTPSKCSLESKGVKSPRGFSSRVSDGVSSSAYGRAGPRSPQPKRSRVGAPLVAACTNAARKRAAVTPKAGPPATRQPSEGRFRA